MSRIMPEQKGNAGEKREDWLKIELFAPAEMIDALSNFMTEIGSRGAYQESLESQSPNGPPEPSAGEPEYRHQTDLGAFYPDRQGHRHRNRPRDGLRHRPAPLHADVPGGD